MQREELTEAQPRRPEPATDAELMAALVGGDRNALGTLYDRHSGLMLALAMRMLQDRAQAEELLHDVFLEAWHHARDFDPSRGSVCAWLVTRTRSRALDRRASRGRQTRVAEQAAREPAPERSTDASASLDFERLRGHVARLPPELLAVLELAYFDGLSSSEIAERVGIPLGTVKSRMARALEALRAQLAPAPSSSPGSGGAP